MYGMCERSLTGGARTVLYRLACPLSTLSHMGTPRPPMREIDEARISYSLETSPSNRLLRGGTRCRSGRAVAPRPPQRRRANDAHNDKQNSMFYGRRFLSSLHSGGGTEEQGRRRLVRRVRLLPHSRQCRFLRCRASDRPPSVRCRKRAVGGGETRRGRTA